MNDNIQGKVIVITGASSGNGEAAARYLAERGAAVVLGARRTERIEALAQELTAAGHKAKAVTTDVTDRDQVKRLVDTAVEAFGRVDVLLNNAGLMPLAPLERLKVDEWDQMIDVNLKGTLYGIAAALPHMKEQKSGHIINVSSVYGHKLGPDATVYCATKFAVRALSEGLRQEVKPYNIRTTVISPGSGAVAALLLHNPHDRAVPLSEGERARDVLLGRPGDAAKWVGRNIGDFGCRQYGNRENPLFWCLHAQDVTPRGRYYPHQWPDGTAQGIIEFFDLLVG